MDRAPINIEATSADVTIWAAVRSRLLKARRSPALLYGYRALNALVFTLLGLLIDRASEVTLLVAFVMWVPLSAFVEWLMTESASEFEERIQEQVDQRAKARLQRLETDAELYAGAQNFLSSRLRRNTGAVTVLRSGDPHLIGVGTSSIERLPAVNETLKELCDSFSSVCSKTYDIPRHDTGFRASYMEVQGPEDNEKLEYFGWHTSDGNPPKSMTEKKFFRKGEGVAGFAWATGRAAIEDFKAKRRWKENYESQSSNYKSMVCVPVVKGFGNDQSKVIGMITVDCSVEGFFGTTDDRLDEDHFARVINPYGTYISFICALDSAVQSLLLRLEGGQSSPMVSAARQLSIAGPDTGTSLDQTSNTSGASPSYSPKLGN